MSRWRSTTTREFEEINQCLPRKESGFTGRPSATFVARQQFFTATLRPTSFTAEPPLIFHPFSLVLMSKPSSLFRVLFYTALQDYEVQMGSDHSIIPTPIEGNIHAISCPMWYARRYKVRNR